MDLRCPSGWRPPTEIFGAGRDLSWILLIYSAEASTGTVTRGAYKSVHDCRRVGNPGFCLGRGHHLAQGYSSHVASNTVPASPPPFGTLGTRVFAPGSRANCEASRSTAIRRTLRNFVLVHLYSLQVDRSFRDTIDGSPEAQYLIDLHAAGLEVEDWYPPLSLADRREQLDRYRSHWDSLQCAERMSLSLSYSYGRIIEGGIICLVLTGDSHNPEADYRFIQLPSVLRGIPLKEWTLHRLPNHRSPGVLPEEDLLVICSPIDNQRYSSKELFGSRG